MQVKKYFIISALLVYLFSGVGVLVHSLEGEQYLDCSACNKDDVESGISCLEQSCSSERHCNNSNHPHHHHPVHQVHNCFICHFLTISSLGDLPPATILPQIGFESVKTASEIVHSDIFVLTGSIRAPPAL